ncbi:MULTISPECIES: amidase [unclassified Acidisoma]|uniref:amidase n=1 Tax=unclassified Acidisoma TaxID=2634065 RepID=UPI00131B85C2|nr:MULTISPECIES: amidase [unclassified Acidisoma]
MSTETDTDLPFTSLSEISARLEKGEITSVTVTRLMLDRIERLNPKLNCFITVLAESALAQAERMDRLAQAGLRLGPLHGVPVAIKDNMATRGIRTTAGSRILADWVPDEDATVVQRLKQAGAVILGKTNLYEFAFGGVHEDYGEVRNPWQTDRTCSASSSGPACVVAAGLAYASLGTDTGGSVRLPAAACGIVGLKPTYGVVSRAGVVPAGYSLDHVGPFARTVRDTALVQNAIAGPDARDPAGSRRPVADVTADLGLGLRGIVAGVPKLQASELIDPQMRAACDAAIASLAEQGAQIVEVDLPDHLLSRTIMWAIAASELAESHRDYLKTRPQDYSPTVLSLVRQGAFMPAVEYVHAHRVRQKIIADYQAVMRSVDVILMPVVPFPAWPVGAEEVTVANVQENLMGSLTRYCPPFNITGQPAISVPAGFDGDGLPLALQIAGRWHEEATVLRVAHAYEQAAGWYRARPPFA